MKIKINIAIILAAILFLMQGCYTMLTHPEVQTKDEDGYTYNEEIVFYDDCQSCHTGTDIDGSNLTLKEKATIIKAHQEQSDNPEVESGENYYNTGYYPGGYASTYFGDYGYYYDYPWWYEIPVTKKYREEKKEEARSAARNNTGGRKNDDTRTGRNNSTESSSWTTPLPTRSSTSSSSGASSESKSSSDDSSRSSSSSSSSSSSGRSSDDSSSRNNSGGRGSGGRR